MDNTKPGPEFTFITIHKYNTHFMCIPAKYATLSGVTSNLSRLCGFAMMPSSMVRILVVRDTVVGVGCRKPFSKCPTNAKWKLAAKEKMRGNSINRHQNQADFTHSDCWIIHIITFLLLNKDGVWIGNWIY
jgi:hypothetical protein